MRRRKPPIYPKSKIKLVKLWPHARKQGHKIGEIWRVGYYSRMDGLNTICLVNRKGDYCWTMDKDFLEKHFEVIENSKEKSIYGYGKPELTAL